MANDVFLGGRKSIRKVIYNAGAESVIKYEKSGKDTRKIPNVRMIVSNYMLPGVPIELLSSDVGGQIINLSFSKSRSAPNGTAGVVIDADKTKYVYDWAPNIVDVLDIFKPYSVCQIFLDGYLIMTGLIRVARRSMSVGKIKTIQVTVDELGVAWQEKQIGTKTLYEGEYSNLLTNVDKIIADYASHKATDDIADSIQNIASAYKASTLLFGRGIFSLSDGFPMAYRLIAQSAPIGAISRDAILSKLTTSSVIMQHKDGSSLWDLLRSLVPSQYCELFTESAPRTIVHSPVTVAPFSDNYSGESPISIIPPGFSSMVMRTNPYDIPYLGSTLWDKSTRGVTLGLLDLVLGGDFVIVNDDIVLEKNLGYSDLQQYTVFSSPFSGQSGQDTGNVFSHDSIAYGPINPLKSGGVKTFGARRLEAPIPAWATNPTIGWYLIKDLVKKIKGSQDSDVSIGTSALSAILTYWFRNQSKFKEGTITTDMIPWARPGMYCLYLKNKDNTFEYQYDLGAYYIENVSHNYTTGGTPTTTLSVIRGVPLPFDLVSVIKLISDYEILPIGLNLFDGDQLGVFG